MCWPCAFLFSKSSQEHHPSQYILSPIRSIGMGKDWFEREHAEVERLSGVLEPRARTLFTFLRHEGGFTQRPSTRRESILWTQLIYRSAELGVEIEIDYTLRLIAVWLIRLEQGKYPVAAGPFSGPVNGVVIRPRLETVLRDQLNGADPILDGLNRLRCAW